MPIDRRLLCAALACCAASLTLPAQAQAQERQAQGRASASIVEPLRAVMREDLSFGALSVSPLADGSLRVPAGAGAATYAGTAAPICAQQSECRPHPAEVDVRGEANRTYRVQLPGSALALGRLTGQSLVVSELRMHSVNRPGAVAAGLLDAEGADVLRVGGLLVVPAGTSADTFRADLTISVSYE